MKLLVSYNKKILSYYHNIDNVGSFDNSKLNVGCGIVGSPNCGDIMKLQIKVNNNIITNACFKTYGCGSAIASSSLVTTLIKGMTLKSAKKINNTEIVRILKLPLLKIHCSILAEDAIKLAISNYLKKNN